MHIIQKYSMTYNKYKYMLNSELESYLSYLYHQRRLKIKEIADDLGCSQATISRLLNRFKIKTKLNKTRFDPTKYGFGNITHMILTIAECLKAGLNKKQISESMKCSRRTLIRICNKYNIN